MLKNSFFRLPIGGNSSQLKQCIVSTEMQNDTKKLMKDGNFPKQLIKDGDFRQMNCDSLDLKQRLSKVEQTSREYMLLKSTLTQVEQECRNTKLQVNDLQNKLHTIETELECMKQKTLTKSDNQSDIIDRLRFSNCQQMDSCFQNKAGETECNSMSTLQAKLMELEQKYELQAAKHEDLTREMSRLRQISSTSRQMPQLPCHNIGSSTKNRSPQPTPVSTTQMCSDKTGKDRSIGDPAAKPSIFQVFIAKYKYDPVQFSPNENPEAELNLNAGDYIFVYGDVDEDGFYDGELMNGKRGLVPSNFVEKVSDEELSEFRSSVGAQNLSVVLSSTRLKVTETSKTTITPAPMMSAPSAESAKHQLLPKSGVDESIDLEDIQEVDEEGLMMTDSKSELSICEYLDPKESVFGFPKELRIDRQLINSVLIAWTAPDCMPDEPVKSYSVYLDEHLKCSVDANDRSKALLEKIDLNKIHHVSVRAVYSRGESADQHCTILIGKGINVSPCDFHVSNITSTTAIVSWMPSNSNLENIILVNSRCRTIIRPGCYRCIVTGLASDLRHTVSIQPRVESSCSGSSKICLTFKTLPSEIPDAPLEIQVEPGPRQGTLLVMWLPVKPDGKPPNSIVNGYSVYVDGRKVKEMLSPTGDHVLLESEDFFDVRNPRQITIRATTATKESHDSLPFSLTSQHLIEISSKMNLGTSSNQNARFSTASPSHYNNNMNTNYAPHPWQPQAPVAQSQMHQHQHQIESQTNSMQRTGGQISLLANPSSMESGFSAQQLSPMETRYASADPEDNYAGYSSQRNTAVVKNSSTLLATNSNSKPMVMLGTVPHIEVTRENNGSLSDSSFDVDLEDAIERRKNRTLTFTPSAQQPMFTPSAQQQQPMTNSISRQSDPAQQHRSRGHHVVQGNSRTDAGDIVVGGEESYLKDAGKRTKSHRVSNSVQGRPLNSKVRVFVALFDYDPATMSPNPDGIDEELPFKEGQIIKVYGTKDADGFYMGESGGQYGLVPSNMISEVDDPMVSAQFLQDSHLQQGNQTAGKPITPPVHQRHQKQGHRGFQEPTELSAPPRHMVAIYNYDTQHMSPSRDNEVKLSFKAGDTILVYGNANPNGYYFGERDGRQGLVPSSYLRDVLPAQTTQQQQQPSTAEPRSRHGSGHSTRDSPDQHGQGRVQQGSSTRIHFDKSTKSQRHHAQDDTQYASSGDRHSSKTAAISDQGTHDPRDQMRRIEKPFDGSPQGRRQHRQ